MEPKQARPRSAKVVPESVREREAFKYEPFLQDTYPINHAGRPLPSAELATSNDVVLTALAQLGLFQTGAERAFVSLFDANSQYILAEATQSTPIAPGLSSDDCPEPLWLCGHAIPRSHGVCEHALYTANNEAGDARSSGNPASSAELPLLLVSDLGTHHLFSAKPFCVPGPKPQFYAAVPIRTSRGINIGTYSVRSSTPGMPWDAASTDKLRRISRAIMGHLAASRERHAYRRNERVTRGLGSLIEGKSTLAGWEHGPNAGAFADIYGHEGHLDKTQQRLERQEKLDEELSQLHGEVGRVALTTDAERELAKKQAKIKPTISDASFFGAQRHNPEVKNETEKGSDAEPALQPHAFERNRKTLFAKAANIIRESFEVEGCIFFDISVGSYRNREKSKPRAASRNEASAAPSILTSSSDDQPPTTPIGDLNAECDLLAFSTSGASSINSASPSPDEARMPKRFLAKLLRRYPNGKVFNFGAGGELQASDLSSSDDDGLLATSRKLPFSDDTTLHSASTGARNVDRPPRQVQEGLQIYDTFAGARSVAFMPIWDAKRERWFAAGFLYTFTPARSFSVQGEVSILKAFLSSISAEVYAQEVIESDKAKSDALGSLSHELRSPLHGIILSTELLNDTNLSVFQGNAAHTIEICCRTLLDTIDHLLDYANINNFLGRNGKDTRAGFPVSKPKSTEGQFGKKRLYSNVRLDGLVEEVIESVFAGFNFQTMSVKQLSRRKTFSPESGTDTSANAWMDKAYAIEHMSPGGVDGKDNAEAGEYGFKVGSVLVYLRVDPTCRWMFYLPGGAIRRIAMNLVGNALKFTNKGAVWVTLSQAKATAKLRPSETVVKLVVQDTGKGISEDFTRFKLYKPFSKEDEFASGTGLGLSIVKKIVASLRGQINMESTLGAGTKFTVTLPLEQSSTAAHLTDEDKAFEEQAQELRGLRVQIIGITSGEDNERDRVDIVEEICRNTLHLDIVPRDNSQELQPDVIVWSEAALPESWDARALHSRTPNVVICQDALTAYGHYTAFESSGYGGVFEFVSQPIGPRKLAQSIQRVFRRWTVMDSNPSPPLRPAAPRRSHSSLSIGQSAPASLPEAPTLDSIDVAVARQVYSPSPRPSDISQQETSASPRNTPPELPTKRSRPAMPNTDTSASADVILIVDDNHINRDVLAAFIHKLGRKYQAAVNGKEAVDAYFQHPDRFPIILMDISMPVMDGFAATREIRKFEHENRRTPTTIVALSGLASTAAQQEALESGVNLFLSKPVRFNVLSETFSSNHV